MCCDAPDVLKAKDVTSVSLCLPLPLRKNNGGELGKTPEKKQPALPGSQDDVEENLRLHHQNLASFRGIRPYHFHD